MLWVHSTTGTEWHTADHISGKAADGGSAEAAARKTDNTEDHEHIEE